MQNIRYCVLCFAALCVSIQNTLRIHSCQELFSCDHGLANSGTWGLFSAL